MPKHRGSKFATLYDRYVKGWANNKEYLLVPIDIAKKSISSQGENPIPKAGYSTTNNRTSGMYKLKNPLPPSTFVG